MVVKIEQIISIPYALLNSIRSLKCTVFFVNWGIFIYSEMRTCLFGFSYALIFAEDSFLADFHNVNIATDSLLSDFRNVNIAEDSLLADFHNFNGSSVECTSGKPKWEGQIIGKGSSGAALEGVRVPFEEGIVLRSVVGQGSWGVVYTDDDRFAIKIDMRNTRAGWEDRRNATMVMTSGSSPRLMNSIYEHLMRFLMNLSTDFKRMTDDICGILPNQIPKQKLQK